MCWFVILGLIMGWFEPPRRDKPRDIPESVRDSDTYLGEVDIWGDIPEFYRAAPAVKEAERVVRSRQGGKHKGRWSRSVRSKP